MENDLEPAVHLLTIKETAELLRVSRRTIHSMIKRNELHPVKIGSQWRFHAGELAKWIQSFNEL
jgi:excisionase family DNA binding protein